MSKIEYTVIGIGSLILCILNIIAIAITVMESQNHNNVDNTALQMAEAGVGITLAVTGLYAIYNGIIYRKNIQLGLPTTENIVNIVVMSILCILNVVAIAILLIESQKETQQIDQTALQMAEAGIGITLASTGIYGIYCLVKAFGNSEYLANTSGLTISQRQALERALYGR